MIVAECKAPSWRPSIVEARLLRVGLDIVASGGPMAILLRRTRVPAFGPAT